MRSVRYLLLPLVALGLSACSTPTPETEAPSTAPLVERHGLAGLSGREIVTKLDASPEDRPLALGASVREHEVVLSEGDSQVAVPLPADEFYVSIAPYINRTHECYHHNLATCTGELASEDISVTITDAAGEVLVEDDTTTYANGFIGYWLPRDVNGTIEISTEGYEGSVPFSTGAGDPTCLTTLRLEPATAG